MRVTANGKEYASIEEAMEQNEYRDIEVEDYEIGGGTGSKITSAHIGTTEDMADWTENQKWDMCGWVEKAQARTIPWHNGSYQDYYTCMKSSITEHKLKIPELTKDTLTMFWDSIDPENDVWVFGTYASSSTELTEEEQTELIEWYVEKNLDKTEAEYSEIIERIGEIADKLGIEEWGDIEKSVAGNYEIIKIGGYGIEICRPEEQDEFDGLTSGKVVIGNETDFRCYQKGDYNNIWIPHTNTDFWQEVPNPELTQENEINNTDGKRKQIGGDHYAKHTIQPWDIIREYELDFFEGNALKYLLRQKGSRLEDLRKAAHYLEECIKNEQKRIENV